MKSRTKLIAAIPLTTVLLAGAAFGQQTTRDQQRQQQQQQETGQHTQDRQAQARSMHVLSGEIIGKGVVDRRGERLGKIGDLVIDLRKGETPYAVLAFGGTLGFNRDQVAVPMEFFSWDQQEERFVLNASKEQLENAPGFHKDLLDTIISHESWIDRTNRVFGADRAQDLRDRGAEEGREQRDRQQTDRDQVRRDRGADQGRQQQQTDRYQDRSASEDYRFTTHAMATDIDSMKVVSADAEELGSFRRLVIDRNSGRIGFVTLRTGGVMGIGSNTHMIPWEALERTENKQFKVSINKNRFETAPQLDDEDKLQNPTFIQSVYSFYQVTPRDPGRSDQRRQDDRRLEERRERRQGG